MKTAGLVLCALLLAAVSHPQITPPPSGGGTVTGVTAMSPIVSSGGAAPVISCPTCSTSSGTVTAVTGTSPIVSSGGATPALSCATCTTTIANGTSTLTSSAITSGTCSTATTTSATGVATTDAIIATVNADPTATTGYVPLTTGSLYVWPYPTANNVNFKVCNNTSASITPTAITLNWRVVR